jgi:putative ABC transport system substrate-binding protein
MRRRAFIGFLGGVATAPLAWPLPAQAQQPDNMTRIGFLPLGLASSDYDLSLVEAFRQGLRNAGLVENRDVTIDLVWIGNEPDYAQAVVELIRRGAKLLVPAGSSAAAAAKRRTATVPIVFISVGNPVGIGLVESLSRPGGNVTGFSDVLADLSGKYVDLAREVGKPQAPVDYLWHTGWPDGQNRLRATERAAESSGVQLRSHGIGDVADLDPILTAMQTDGAATLIVQPSPFTYRHRIRLVDAAKEHRLAAIYAFPPAGKEGALIAYGPDYADLYRRAGSYIDRILKGMKPADLPVEQPTKFKMVVNLETAKILDVTVPPHLLALADEVIE